MESKDKQGKSHGSDQGGGGEQLPQQQVVDAPKDQHAANLPGRTWFAGTVRFLAFLNPSRAQEWWSIFSPSKSVTVKIV